MIAVTRSIAEMESNLTEMIRGMHEMQRQLQQQQLNLTQIITNIVSLTQIITNIVSGAKICAHSEYQIALPLNYFLLVVKFFMAV